VQLSTDFQFESKASLMQSQNKCLLGSKPNNTKLRFDSVSDM